MTWLQPENLSEKRQNNKIYEWVSRITLCRHYTSIFSLQNISSAFRNFKMQSVRESKNGVTPTKCYYNVQKPQP